MQANFKRSHFKVLKMNNVRKNVVLFVVRSENPTESLTDDVSQRAGSHGIDIVDQTESMVVLLDKSTKSLNLTCMQDTFARARTRPKGR